MIPVAYGPLGPVGMNNRSLAGAVGDDCLSTMDLHAKVWGKVIDTPTTLANGDLMFHITDGSAAGSPDVIVSGMWDEVLFADDFNAGKKTGWRDDQGTTHNSSPLGTLVADDKPNVAVVSSVSVKDVVVSVDFNAAAQGLRPVPGYGQSAGIFSRAQNAISCQKINGK